MPRLARSLLIALALLLPAVGLAVADRGISIVAGTAPTPAYGVETSGVNGENLSDTPVTDVIDMWLQMPTNQLSWTFVVTPGSTTSLTTKCYESDTGTGNTWSQIGICDGNAAAACAPDTRTYTLSDFETQTGKKIIDSNWKTKKQFAKCKLDDAADGTGTVVITGTRSWQ